MLKRVFRVHILNAQPQYFFFRVSKHSAQGGIGIVEFLRPQISHEYSFGSMGEKCFIGGFRSFQFPDVLFQGENFFDQFLICPIIFIHLICL